MGTNTPNANVLPARPSVEPRTIAPIRPITACVARQLFMAIVMRRGATLPAKPNSPATEISSVRLRCTAENYDQMNAKQPMAKSAKSTATIMPRKPGVKSHAAISVRTANTPVIKMFKRTMREFTSLLLTHPQALTTARRNRIRHMPDFEQPRPLPLVSLDLTTTD